MKLIRKTSLVRRQKSTLVHCEIELYEAPGAPERYLVNLRQGRAGEEWRESTRTLQPVDLPTAETLFAMALVERMAQGFVDPAAEIAPEPVIYVAAAEPSRLGPADLALLGRLETGSWKKLSQHLRSRTIWRIGERRLRAAVPLLVDLIARGNPMQDYCIAWAVGRCGDAGAAVAMRELAQRGETDPVRRMALQAWLMLADQVSLKRHADTLIADTPAALRDAWASRNEHAISSLTANWVTLGSGNAEGYRLTLSTASDFTGTKTL